MVDDEEASYILSPDDALEDDRETRILGGDFFREIDGEERGSPLEPAGTTDPFNPREDTDVDVGEQYFDDEEVA